MPNACACWRSGLELKVHNEPARAAGGIELGCFVCHRTAGVDMTSSGDIAFVNCPGCGAYAITAETVSEVRKDPDYLDVALVRRWLEAQRSRGITIPLVNALTFSWL